MPYLIQKPNSQFSSLNLGGISVSKSIIKIIEVKRQGEGFVLPIVAFLDKNASQPFWNSIIFVPPSDAENLLFTSPSVESVDIQKELELNALNYIISNPQLIDANASNPNYIFPFDIMAEKYRRRFIQSELSAGILTVIHKLSTSSIRIVVKDNTKEIKIRYGGNDEMLSSLITITNNNRFTVNLTSFAPITGNWVVVVTNIDA